MGSQWRKSSYLFEWQGDGVLSEGIWSTCSRHQRVQEWMLRIICEILFLCSQAVDVKGSCSWMFCYSPQRFKLYLLAIFELTAHHLIKVSFAFITEPFMLHQHNYGTFPYEPVILVANVWSVKYHSQLSVFWQGQNQTMARMFERGHKERLCSIVPHIPLLQSWRKTQGVERGSR